MRTRHQSGAFGGRGKGKDGGKGGSNDQGRGGAESVEREGQLRQQAAVRRPSRVSSGAHGAEDDLERGSAEAADKVHDPVDELQRALGFRVVENAGRRNCFKARDDVPRNRMPSIVSL